MNANGAKRFCMRRRVGDVRRCTQADDRHACRHSRLRAGWGIFNRKASASRNPKAGSGDQVNVRMRLSACHAIRAVNMVAKMVAERELVIPSRPHALRMRLESALAEVGRKPRVGLEIESVPAILDLVQRHPLHAVLSMNAVRGSGQAGWSADAALPMAEATLATPTRPKAISAQVPGSGTAAAKLMVMPDDPLRGP